jgi:hypothetical protein
MLTPLRGLALVCGGAAMAAALACHVDVTPPADPGARAASARYTVNAIPPAGRKGTAVRRRFCAQYQCASAGDKVWCMDRCVNVWDFADAGAPRVPGPGADQQVYRYDSDHQSSPGVIGTAFLRLGKRTFRATHTGTGNFILYVTSTEPDSAPDVAFNEIGAGTWTWTMQVRHAGTYTIDLKAADGEWTVSIE